MPLESPARRGRPARLSRELIFDAVARRTDGGWTMASLAADLGVTPHALYYYFPNKQALVHAFGRSVIDSIELPPCRDGDWPAWLHALAAIFYDNALRYPSLRDPEAAALLRGDEDLVLFERMLDVLVSCGFGVEQAATALSLVMGTTETHIRLTLASAEARGISDVLGRDDLPHLSELAKRPQHWEVRRQFDLAVDWVVAGVRDRVFGGHA